MRVAVDLTAIGPEPSGARTRALRLLAAAARLPSEFELVAFCARGAGLVESLSAAGIEALEVDPAPRAWRRALSGPGPWLRRLEDARADLVQWETLPPPSTPLPSLVTVHDLRFLERKAGAGTARRLYARLFLPRALRRVGRLVAVSRHTARALTERLGVEAERIDVVPNGADPDLLDRPPAVEEGMRFRKRFGLEGQLLLGLGHLEPRKDWPVVVRALGLLRTRFGFPDVTLVLAGAERGAGRAVLGEARRFGLAEQVRLLGPIDDEARRGAFAAAALLVHPARVEGFGLVPLDALASGLPVVAARAGALPEVLGEAAEFAAPGEAEAFARAMARLLRIDPDERRNLAERGRERARSFSWEASARRLLLAFSRATGTRPALAAGAEPG